MISLIATAAIAIAAVTAPSAPAATRAAPSVSVPARALAAAPSRRQRDDQQIVSVERSATSVDEEAIQRQLQLRVQLPPLSGDGGS